MASNDMKMQKHRRILICREQRGVICNSITECRESTCFGCLMIPSNFRVLLLLSLLLPPPPLPLWVPATTEQAGEPVPLRGFVSLSCILVQSRVATIYTTPSRTSFCFGFKIQRKHRNNEVLK